MYRARHPFTSSPALSLNTLLAFSIEREVLPGIHLSPLLRHLLFLNSSSNSSGSSSSNEAAFPITNVSSLATVAAEAEEG